MSEEKNECDSTPGILGWNELITPNKAASMEFYSKLFGWEAEHMELSAERNYTLFKLGERPVAGCYEPDGEASVPPMWMSYINVEDLDAAVEKAKALGATVCKERVDIPMGSFAIISDPQGAVIAFWQGAGECS